MMNISISNQYLVQSWKKKINELTDIAGIDLVEEDLTTRESDVEENVCVS